MQAAFCPNLNDRGPIYDRKENAVAKEEKRVLTREDKKKKEEKGIVSRVSGRIRRYFTETIGELRKVNWPTRKEATNLTIVVLVVTISMSMLLGLLDYVFQQFFALLFA
jgi:preprotein translocase subunit SecE